MYQVSYKSNYTILNTRWKSDLYPFEKTTKFRFQSHQPDFKFFMASKKFKTLEGHAQLKE